MVRLLYFPSAICSLEDNKISPLLYWQPISTQYMRIVHSKLSATIIINFPSKVISLKTKINPFFPKKIYKFFKYFYLGLGYKVFLRQSKLYIWLGLTHYTILDAPNEIQIFTRKKRFFVVSITSSQQIFNNFIFRLRNTRKVDLYKSKGLLEVKTYKGFIKMKTGKKKQY